MLLHEPEELVSVGTAAPNPAAPPSLRRRRADLRRRREPRWGKGSRRLVAGLLVAGCCRELAAAVVKDLPFPCCRWREGDRNDQKSVQVVAGAAAGQGSCVSVILTAGSGSVTSRTAAEASGYFCRRRKTLPVRALNLVFIRLRFRKLYHLCMWVSVTNAGVRSLLSFEMAAGLPPNRFRDRRCSVQPFLLRFDNVAMVIVNVAVS
nr:uncharacterized protein LOC114925360 [Arachis hypogaea]